MKKRLITLFISSLLLVTPLLNTSANASTYGWNRIGEYETSNYWYYVYPDGSWAKGWQYIDGNWYYFINVEGKYVTVSGKAYIDQNGYWANAEGSCFDIEGRAYFFDHQGRLLTNTYVVVEGVTIYIDANGHPGI